MAFSSSASINFRVLFRVIGWLLLIESIFLVVPLVTAIVYHESDWVAFTIALGATLAAGLCMTTFIKPRSNSMRKREGFLLTALVWIFFSIFGMIPFMLMPDPLDLSDAFFETMSGFTTTGATVFSSISHLSHSIIMWRSVMQWIGGMGIILFTLAVLPMLNNNGGMQMFNAEVTGITHDKLRPRVSSTAKGLWLVYIGLTVVLFFLLMAGPMDVFESLCHAFSTMSTGGFSTHNDSLAAWDSDYVLTVVTIFMFLGGVNFALIFRALHGDLRPVWHNDTFRAYLKLILLMYVLFTLSVIAHGQISSVKSVTLEPLFMVVSTVTSTGYVTTGFGNWGTFALALTFVLMFTGACAGSTSGGAKVDRMLVLGKHARNEIYRCVHPNNIYTVRLSGRAMSPDLVSKVIIFLCLYCIIIVTGAIALTAMGVPLVDAFFSAFSCISNTGFDTAITGYGAQYDIIPALGKWVLSLIMLTGRLEVFTILLLFTSTFWKK